MLYYIILTTVCNQRCIYCCNAPDPNIQPLNLQVKIEDIKKFISYDKEPYICFYGGEPTLRPDIILDIIGEIRAEKFILQTNGLLLDKMDWEIIKNLDVIIVSIDGRPEVTDYYRGKGTYNKVIKNLQYLRRKGYEGEIIARMVISGYSDVYRDVKHLIEFKNSPFNYVHWQLDVLWDYPPYQRYENFDSWVSKIYNPGISRLVNYWVNNLKKGRVLGIIPFMSITYSLLMGSKSELRCGSGINAFAIATDGKILACPIAPEFKFNQLGDIWSLKPYQLPYKVKIGEPCTSCNYLWVCGGRCLFANKTMLWGLEGFKKVCKTVIHLIDELKENINIIKEVFINGSIDINYLNYPKYPNSIEVIP